MTVARVRVTVGPAIEGGTVVLKGTVSCMPSRGVFFTANAAFAKFAAAARSSSKVRTKDAPFTSADANTGAVTSGVSFVTSWSVKLAVSLPEASSILLNRSVSGLV